MNEFKEGDSVRVTHLSLHSGKVGTVQGDAMVGDPDSLNKYYWIKFSDGPLDLFAPEDLEPADPM